MARLTWQVPEPASLAAGLRRRLAIEARADADAEGTYLVALGASRLEIVPWQREAPGDDPQPGGRLVLEPLETGLITDGGSRSSGLIKGGSPAGRSPASGMSLAAIAWATVELARAARELGPWLADDHGRGPEPLMGQRDPGDPHLGARTLVRPTNGLPGEVLVLAEPATEGRLSASLARHGEGPVALYLRPASGLDAWVADARSRHVTLSARREGPLGPQVLVLPEPAPEPGPAGPGASGDGDPDLGGIGSGGTRTAATAAMVGPHLIVVGDASLSSRVAPDGTIRA